MTRDTLAPTPRPRPRSTRRAGKVNVPLLGGLAAAAVIVVGGLFAFYWFFVRTSVQDLIHQGDQAVAAGEYRQATSFYGSAIKREPRDADLMIKYVDAVKQRPAEDIVEARFLLSQIIEFTRRATEARPGDEELLDNFYGLLWRLGRELNPSFFDQLVTLTDEELSRNPDNVLAHRYRGIATVQRLTSDDPIEVREQALEDLNIALAENPDDTEARQAIILWDLAEAAYVREAGYDEARVRELIESAIDRSQDLLEEDPDDIERICSHLDILLMPSVARVQAARPIVEDLEKRLLEDPTPRRAVLLLVDLLPRIFLEEQPNPNSTQPTTDGIIRAEKLALRAVEAYPDILDYRLLAARLQRIQGKLDEAYDQYKVVADRAYEGYAIETVTGYQKKILASYNMGDIRLAQLQDLSDTQTEQRQAYEKEVEQIVQSIANVEGEDLAMVKKLKGKLRLQQGDYGEAMILLDEALLATDNNDIELLILSAQARLRMGAPNAAADQLAQAVARRPGLMRLRTELAKIYLGSSQEKRAREQLQIVLATEPGNVDALKLMAGVLASDGKVDEAIAQYRKLDPVAQHPELLQPTVQLMIRAGRKDEARELVERRFGYDPKDLNALRMMISLYPDPQQRELFFEQALAAGADQAAVNALRDMAEGRATTVALPESAAEENPYAFAMSKARESLSQGRIDEAREYTEQALEAQRDDLAAMSMLFSICIDQQNWQRAEELVNRVTVRNLDLANGAFWQGRLAQARGDFTKAINFFRRGLEARPIYPLGHRQLGDLLLRVQDYEGAIRAYETSLSQRSRNMPAMRGLAAAFDELGQHEKALEKIREMLRQDSTNVELIKLYINYEQTYGSAERALQQRNALKEFNPRDFENRRGLAQTLAKLGRFDEAILEMETIIEEEGFTRLNAAFMAALYREERRDEDAIEVIDEYLASRGDQADEGDYMLKGRNLLEMDRVEAAVAAYREAMAREDPRFMMASREFGDRMFERQAYPLAIQTYTKVNEAQPEDVGVELRLCEALIRAEKYDEARERLNRIGMTNPKVPPLLASIAQREGDIDRALTLLDQAIQINKNDPALYGLRGRMLLMDPSGDNVSAAIRDLNRELALRPTQVETWVLLAQVYMSAGDTEEAIPTLRKLLELDPENVRGRLALVNLHNLRGDVEEARSVLEEAMELFPEGDEWPRLLADLEAKQQNRRQASLLWEKAVDINPSPQNIAGLVVSYINSNQTQAAIDAFLTHVEIVNQEPYLQALRARVLLAANAEKEARNVALKALERSSRFPQLQAVAVQIGQAFGPEPTIAMIDEVDKLDLHPEPWVQLTTASLYMDARQFDKTQEILTELKPRIDEADTTSLLRWHELKGNVSFRLGDFERAAESFQFVVDRNPEDGRTLNNLAFVLSRKLNRAAEALPLAQRAYQLMPGNAATMDTLGVVLWANGRRAQARDMLERAIRVTPLAASQLHLAQLLIEMNQPEDYEKIRTLLDSAKRQAERDQEADLLKDIEEAEKAYDALGFLPADQGPWARTAAA